MKQDVVGRNGFIILRKIGGTSDRQGRLASSVVLGSAVPVALRVD